VIAVRLSGRVFDFVPARRTGRASADGHRRERVRFGDPGSAASLLQRAASRGGAGDLRVLLGGSAAGEAIRRLSDAEVVRELAKLVVAGDVVVLSRPDVVRYGRRTGEQEAEAVEYIGPRTEPEVVEPAELSGPDQAEALRAAAREGVPFCEECAKAAAAAKARAAAAVEPPEIAPSHAAAQAEALRAAALDGAPFCEECAKAAAAEKAAKAQVGRADAGAPGQAAKQQAAAVEPPEIAPLHAAAQAQTLRQASAQGAPFCEECEKARRGG
jgi:hypothetical protein